MKAGTKRRGRPILPKGQARRAVLSVRLTASERALLEKRAGAEGATASDWAREVLVQAIEASK